MTKIKICGLKTLEDIKKVNAIMPDYIGFVLAPSKREITCDTAKKLKEALHPRILSVGVFVNADLKVIGAYEREGIIDQIQLHGEEDEAYIQALKRESHLPIIKAFRIRDGRNLKESLSLEDYQLLQSNSLDGILLDTYQPNEQGGSGKRFNWQVLKDVKRPYFLAGGIGIDCLEEVLSYQPYAIDVSSRVETNGEKDKEKMKQLVEALRRRV